MTIRPVRLRLSRAKGFNLQSHSRAINGLPAASCARPGRWSNRHKIRPGVSAGDAIRRYRRDCDRWMSIRELRKLIDTELRGRNLACWCKLCERHLATGKPFDEDCPGCALCHCDVLGPIANRPLVCEEVAP